MTSWTPITKNTSSYSNVSKNTSSYTNQSKSVSYDFLLKEDGFYLLQENGGRIILEQSTGSYTPNYTFVTKN